MQQQTLFGNKNIKVEERRKNYAGVGTTIKPHTQSSIVDGEVLTEEQKDFKFYTPSYCKSAIKNEMYLWDMRCWDKYHNKDEVMKILTRLEKGESWITNAGHIEYCVKMLFKQQFPKEQICEWFMLNTQIQYKHRLVKCFENAELCPKYNENNRFENCGECDKK